MPAQDAGQSVEQQIEIHRLGEHGKHVHPQRFLEQVIRELTGEQDRA
jgi:hypothetical protein